MAIKIHHGPNGSYKTSGAVWDDAVPAAKAGRLIITNVRGMSSERFYAIFDDLPSTFDVEYINHESQAGMDRIRNWYQWAPRNAFLIFDEAQTLFPHKWTQKDLDKFDYPGGLDAASAADRPMNFLDAWTRHRHWNWDVILTTPNIKYVHTEIRQTSEAAYQHSNLALLGKWMKKLVGKDYKEAMHSAQENRAPTDGSNIVALRKIDPRVFKLYDSTATGQHRDTMAGKNALASPRVVALLVAVFAVFGACYWFTGGNMFHNPLDIKTPVAATKDARPAAAPAADSPSHVPADRVSAQSAPALDRVNDPYQGYEISIKGSIQTPEKGVMYLFQVAKADYAFAANSWDMQQAGYRIYARGSCAAELVYEGQSRTVACLGKKAGSGSEARLGAEQRAAAAGLPSSSTVSAQAGGSARVATGAAGQVPVTVVADTSRMPRTL